MSKITRWVISLGMYSLSNVKIHQKSQIFETAVSQQQLSKVAQIFPTWQIRRSIVFNLEFYGHSLNHFWLSKQKQYRLKIRLQGWKTLET